MTFKCKKISIIILVINMIWIMGYAQNGLKKDIKREEFQDFLIIGHRGTRGLMPESTLPAMIKGINVGANTLETDLQVTKDRKIILNHDNTFNPYFVRTPEGKDIPLVTRQNRTNNSFIPESDQENYILYNMNYDEIKKYRAGGKFYPEFPEQEQIETYIPLLTEVIDSVEMYIEKNEITPVIYMPEIKSNPEYYGEFQPYPEEFVSILMHALQPYMNKIKDRLIIQSADPKPLQILHRDYPKIQLAWLNSNRNISLDEQFERLGFKPDFYLPHFKLVNKELVEKCHARDIRIIPWTPDIDSDILRMIKLNVDGVITNYPDRLYRIYKNFKNK